MKRAREDKAGKALADARRLVQSGHYAAALEKHVWFHDHALAVEPSYYGVRLSFALRDWVELGRKYPPAMEKLQSIRDEKIALLSSGSREREVFHDVVSINEYLGQREKTVQLFNQFDAADPE